MRLLEKVEKMEKHKKTPTPPAHSSGNFKSKLQFQGMNPINISFKIGFAFFFLFFVFLFFSKVQKSNWTVPTSQGMAGKGIFWEWIEPQTVWFSQVLINRNAIRAPSPFRELQGFLSGEQNGNLFVQYPSGEKAKSHFFLPISAHAAATSRSGGFI